MLFSKKKKDFSDSDINLCIVGLGNPGDKYELTRHNAGFMVIDYLADKCGVTLKKLKFKALYTTANLAGKKVLLVKPQTFMNNSGESVRDIIHFYKLNPSQTLIIFDDISLEPGKLRIKRKGSDGGHNGMKSIVNLCGSQDFPRIKLGIGAKPNPEYNLADWVLSKFRGDDISAMEQSVKSAADAASLIAKGEIDNAMNRYNS